MYLNLTFLVSYCCYYLFMRLCGLFGVALFLLEMRLSKTFFLILRKISYKRLLIHKLLDKEHSCAISHLPVSNLGIFILVYHILKKLRMDGPLFKKSSTFSKCFEGLL